MEGVTARDLMSREYVGVTEGDRVDDVLELMVEEHVDEVLVLRGTDPVGVVSAHDVLQAVHGPDPDEEEPVESMMGRPPDPVPAEEDLSTVVARLSATEADQLPVTNGQQELVGVVTDADLIAAANSLLAEPRGVEADVPGEDVGASGGARLAGTAPGEPPEEARTEATQGVCESCGSLSADLQVHNGQSTCPDCRDV